MSESLDHLEKLRRIYFLSGLPPADFVAGEAGACGSPDLNPVMDGAKFVLKPEDVMEGVSDLLPLIQVEAVFTDGSRLVSLHNPIT